MDQIKIIPKDLLCIIPKFEGDEGTLNFFIRKCQYIYDAFADASNNAQQIYIFHALSSRLYGRAANLISVREDINSWEGLKEVLIQHFGDSRPEEAFALELEQMKIRNGESYTDFYRRILLVRSTLFAKLNGTESFKAAKMSVFNNTAFNTFIYNLTEDLVHVVRHKQCKDLETALKVVIEEENFMSQYKAKNRQGYAPFKPAIPPPSVFYPQANTNRTCFGSQPASTGFGASQKASVFGASQGVPFGSEKLAGLPTGLFGAAPAVKDSTKPLIFGNPPQTISIGNPNQAKANEKGAGNDRD